MKRLIGCFLFLFLVVGVQQVLAVSNPYLKVVIQTRWDSQRIVVFDLANNNVTGKQIINAFDEKLDQLCFVSQDREDTAQQIIQFYNDYKDFLHIGVMNGNFLLFKENGKFLIIGIYLHDDGHWKAYPIKLSSRVLDTPFLGSEPRFFVPQ